MEWKPFKNIHILDLYKYKTIIYLQAIHGRKKINIPYRICNKINIIYCNDGKVHIAYRLQNAIRDVVGY